ncbi:exopolysaccharide biosynthesis polyprenyl glycosylphosphotransferase [Bacteroides sp. OttesenSCG-928-D19]|nr:exopolysaccharide biosynthesis polyprenyl glycosylphosphotransferase [Bacteroides sp. OttesenSCG-928-D19]
MTNNYSIIYSTKLDKKTNRFVKRAFDVLFSSVVLICVFPIVFLVLFVCIKLSMPGPVFFKQKRTGKNGKTFICYKFRTMKINSDADIVQAVNGDPRITALGRFLRLTSVDELPQFWNVLKGDMSVIGPRPHMLAHTKEFSELIDNYDLRHRIKPGITGWAQINGYRGEVTFDKMKKRVEFDLFYINNWSLKLDFIIILRTFKIIFSR